MLLLIAFVMFVIGVPMAVEYVIRREQSTLSAGKRELQVAKVEINQKVKAQAGLYLAELTAKAIALKDPRSDGVSNAQNPIVRFLGYMLVRGLMWLLEKMFVRRKSGVSVI
jgi:hypothetical protein